MLEAEGISVRYGPLEAVRGVSFEVGEGRIVALIGANGAGKSTTLKALMGMLPIAAGSLRWQGRAIESTGSSERVRLGMALSPEGRRLFPRMTVLDNLLVGAHVVHGRKRIDHALELVYGLFPRVAERRRQLAGSLSGGEQQMVAIARALMAGPKVLMLDEPSLGLAPKIVAEIAAAIVRINNETGMAVVLVEQNARLALKLAHHAYVYEQGRIIRSGSGAALLADPFVQKAYLGL
ncbi:MAG: ABC transporter ATP-binding protein [Burkholderiaceae bacterium]|nr:ABC transporter ATP-binding protein [Burkholderiaceae bacterium]